MARIEWPDFAQFDRSAFRVLRGRYGVRAEGVSVHTPRPRITPREIQRWEKGTSGSVSDAWRYEVYRALRAAIIAACERTAARLRAEAEDDEGVPSSVLASPILHRPAA